jgi:cobalt-zinc-cadmium efflux system protein
VGHHHHHHGTGRVLIISTIATTLFVFLELWAGVHAHSLALLSDAGHNFTDAFALVLALVGVYLQSKPADEVKTYGYHRGGVLAAFINALTLIALSVYILWESYRRFLNPEPVSEQTMIVVAAAGIVLNVAILLGLRRSQQDLNIRAASVHMLGDALGSVAIVVGAVVIGNTGWLWIDPALSVAIALLIIWSAVDITRESLNILLEGLPRGIELENVKDSLCKVPGVLDVHDVHIWSLGSNTHALSCHALIDDMPPSESDCILCAMNDVLAREYHVHHTTVQFEHVRCELGKNGCVIHPEHEHDHGHQH